MAPLFAELSDDPAHSSLDFFVCDIDVNEVRWRLLAPAANAHLEPSLSQQAAQEVGIRTVPAFMVFKEMTKLEEVMGAQPAALKVRLFHPISARTLTIFFTAACRNPCESLIPATVLTLLGSSSASPAMSLAHSSPTLCSSYTSIPSISNSTSDL